MFICCLLFSRIENAGIRYGRIANPPELSYSKDFGILGILLCLFLYSRDLGFSIANANTVQSDLQSDV